MSKPTPIGRFLARSGQGSKGLLRRVDEQNRLLVLLKQAIPSFLHDHCIACVAKKGNLIIFTDSPAWASKLRFHSNLIAKEVRRLLPSSPIERVKPRVLPSHAKPEARKRFSKIPSSETIYTLRNSANTQPDIELKDALLRLAHTLDQQSAGSKKKPDNS